MTEPRARHEHIKNQPKNYRRSDERVLEDVCDALADHGDFDASDVEVHVEDGTVILRGTVRSRWAKWYAFDVAAGIRGVEDVVNELRIARTPSGAEAGGPTSDGRSVSSLVR
jgi:osmotically-inducible protein OsmY